MIARNWRFDEAEYFKVKFKPGLRKASNRQVGIHFKPVFQCSLMKTSDQPNAINSVHDLFATVQVQHQTGVFLDSIASLWLAKYITGTVFRNNRCSEGCCCFYTINNSRLDILSNHNTWKSRLARKTRENWWKLNIHELWSRKNPPRGIGECFGTILSSLLSLPVSHIHTQATADKYNKKFMKAYFLSKLKGKINRFPKQINSNEWFIICVKHGSSGMGSLWPPLVGLIYHIITETSRDGSSCHCGLELNLWSKCLFA